MEIVNITSARQNLFQLISDVNKGFNPINYVDSVKETLKKDRSKCTVYKKGERW